MKKSYKRTYILITICIAMLVYFIGIYNYRKPVTIHKTFNNVTVLKPGTEEKVIAEINAKLYRGIYQGSIIGFDLHFTNRIEGTIIIDGKEYKFEGFNGKSKPVNIIGSVYEYNHNSSRAFIFKMADLDSLELLV